MNITFLAISGSYCACFIAQLIHLDLSLSVLLHHKRNVTGKIQISDLLKWALLGHGSPPLLLP